MRVYTAKHLLPVAARPVRDGAVAVEDGTVVAVGPAKEVVAAAGADATVHDLDRSVILPGLVNAHTHLELSWLAGHPELQTGDYTRWLRSLLALRDAGPPPEAESAAESALESMLARGTVAIGDVTNDCRLASMLARHAIHGVVFFELYGLKTSEAEARIAKAAETLERLSSDPALRDARGLLSMALTPHAPHTTSPALLRALAGRATAAAAPLSIHVAESEAELALLRDGEGPLAALFRERGFLDDDWAPPERSPVEHLLRLGALSERTVAVHCVRLESTDHATLQRAGATVVTCPRSNAALGVGRAAVPALMRAGIPVAIGTDSLASVPDLDLLAEMAALLDTHQELSPAAAVRMATLNGARALGLDRRLGSIERGKLAKLIAIPLPSGSDDPFEAVCGLPEEVIRLDQLPETAAG